MSASLSTHESERVVELTGAMDQSLVEREGERLEEVEAAASVCLSALLLKATLRKPAILAVPEDSEWPRRGNESTQPVVLRLGHVRAVSPSEVEYYYRSVSQPPQIPSSVESDHRSERQVTAYRIADVASGEGFCLSLLGADMALGVRRAMQMEMGVRELVMHRSDLVKCMVEETGHEFESISKDLLGLDEWRFREGLRKAFDMVIRSSEA